MTTVPPSRRRYSREWANFARLWCELRAHTPDTTLSGPERVVPSTAGEGVGGTTTTAVKEPPS